jgi:hypothetical protein
MKRPIKLLNRVAKVSRLAVYILMMVVICGPGCVSPTPVPDPLAGWKVELNHRPDQTIVKDYQDYIQETLSGKGYFIDENNIWFFKDGSGQHAIKIEIPLNGVWREHVLIYDKDNKRIKVIKYAGGRYAC